MEIKACRNWKLSELHEWSVIASTTNDDIVDFQKMPKMTEMTPIWPFDFQYGSVWSTDKNEFDFHWIFATYVSEVTLVPTGNHNLLNIEYYSKVLDNRFWYPVGY